MCQPKTDTDSLPDVDDETLLIGELRHDRHFTKAEQYLTLEFATTSD
jgi:hypothetical protein